MWEYKRKDYKFRLNSELVNELNKEGDENWEIIYFTEQRTEQFDKEHIAKVLFKRPKLNTK